MWERGCFPATILEQLRRLCRPRHPYAVPRTSLQCVCTRRRNCIAQLSPSRSRTAEKSQVIVVGTSEPIIHFGLERERRGYRGCREVSPGIDVGWPRHAPTGGWVRSY